MTKLSLEFFTSWFGANVNVQDKEGDCPLGVPAKRGFIDVVIFSLSKSANPC